MQYTRDFYADALRETESARLLLIQQAYARKLEQRIHEMHLELEAAGEACRVFTVPTQEQVNKLLDALPKSTDNGIFARVKVVRAAYNLGLKEAKDMVENWLTADDIPF
jgi:ribosomal protein L7/L12